MRYIIISNGDIKDYNWAKKIIEDHDYIICADGGARHVHKMDIIPNIIVGDLDSIDDEAKNYFMKKKVEFNQFPRQKDFTDTELAIELAMEHGAKEITLMAVMGSRMDHTLTNITALLPLSLRGIKAKIIDEKNEIIATTKPTSLKGNKGDLVSIIPLSERVEGITLKGLEYPLNNANITVGSSIGISNKFIDSNAKIEFKSGAILIIKARD